MADNIQGKFEDFKSDESKDDWNTGHLAIPTFSLNLNKGDEVDDQKLKLFRMY